MNYYGRPVIDCEPCVPMKDGSHAWRGIMRSAAAMLVGLLVGLTTYETFCASAQADGSPTATEKTARIALVQEFVQGYGDYLPLAGSCKNRVSISQEQFNCWKANNIHKCWSSHSV
jgi:hypothetical protein